MIYLTVLTNLFFQVLKAINASFIALVPKKPNPQDHNDFRPICLVGSVYCVEIIGREIKECHMKRHL